MIRLLIASLLFVGLAVAEDKKEEKKEPKKLDGVWVAEKATMNGEDARKVFESLVLTIKGDAYIVELNGESDKGTLKIDNKKDPAEMDITSVEGPNKGKVTPCIYKWEGDNIVVCYGLDAKTRPTDFTAKKNSTRMLVTYKPKKK